MTRLAHRTILLGLGLCFVLAARAPAQQPSADDEVARNLFQAGKAAYEAGNFEDALSFFEQSHARSHRPQLLYNIGQAADRMRNDDKALAAFRAYLAALPDAENRAEVENRIRALERTRNPYGAAPTPRDAAHTAAPSASTLSPSAATQADVEPITSKWWFWTGVGAVVVAGVVSAIALSSGDSRQPAIEGNTGVVVTALGGTR